MDGLPCIDKKSKYVKSNHKLKIKDNYDKKKT